MRHFAMPDGRPQLVEQMLRQTGVHAGDKHLRAQRLELANAIAELFLVLLIRHEFACGPYPSACSVRSAEETHSHTTPLPSPVPLSVRTCANVRIVLISSRL